MTDFGSSSPRQPIEPVGQARSAWSAFSPLIGRDRLAMHVAVTPPFGENRRRDLATGVAIDAGGIDEEIADKIFGNPLRDVCHAVILAGDCPRSTAECDCFAAGLAFRVSTCVPQYRCGRSPDRATGRDRRSPETRETCGRGPSAGSGDPRRSQRRATERFRHPPASGAAKQNLAAHVHSLRLLLTSFNLYTCGL